MTDAQKHTPGPWEAVHAIVWAPDGRSVAHASLSDSERKPLEARANARLIAAAPDMLEALHEAMRQTVKHHPDNGDRLCFNCRAVGDANEDEPFEHEQWCWVPTADSVIYGVTGAAVQA